MLSFVRLTETAVPLSPGRRVLKAADYQALIDAETMRETARAEAAATLAEANRQAAAILAGAERQREAEKARGYAEGRDEADAEAIERRMALAFHTTDYLESLEESVIDLVMSGVRKILGSFDDRTLAANVVAAALGVMRNQKQITLRISPADAEGVRERLEAMLVRHPGIGVVEVMADSRLARGGCILESDLGIVDAGLETQLARLEAALSKRLGDGKAGRRQPSRLSPGQPS